MRRLAILVLVIATALPAGAVSKRKRCQRACGAAVTACVEGGTRRRRCKRVVMKQCLKQGVAACAVATTTTTTTLVPGGGATTTTTTTIAGQLNGCDIGTAVDWTGRSAVAIDFPAGGFNAYSPPCVRVSTGTQVTFNGPFAQHPLVGGEVTGPATKVPDPTSPFVPVTNSGTMRSVILSDAGAFPFYCDVHAFEGMKGVVFVIP